MGNKVFIVYGHDKQLILKVENLLLKNGIEYVKLGEEEDISSLTIIESFEEYADDAGCAICLLTGSEDDPAIRPNVLFEMGYFAGKLGRKHVVTISSDKYKEKFPSDLKGLKYIPEDEIEIRLIKGLEAMGIQRRNSERR